MYVAYPSRHLQERLAEMDNRRFVCGLQEDTGRIYPTRNGRTYVAALIERDVPYFCGRVHDEAVDNMAGAVIAASSADGNANVSEATNGG